MSLILSIDYLFISCETHRGWSHSQLTLGKTYCTPVKWLISLVEPAQTWLWSHALRTGRWTLWLFLFVSYIGYKFISREYSTQDKNVHWTTIDLGLTGSLRLEIELNNSETERTKCSFALCLCVTVHWFVAFSFVVRHSPSRFVSLSVCGFLSRPPVVSVPLPPLRP